MTFFTHSLPLNFFFRSLRFFWFSHQLAMMRLGTLEMCFDCISLCKWQRVHSLNSIILRFTLSLSFFVWSIFLQWIRNHNKKISRSHNRSDFTMALQLMMIFWIFYVRSFSTVHYFRQHRIAHIILETTVTSWMPTKMIAFIVHLLEIYYGGKEPTLHRIQKKGMKKKREGKMAKKRKYEAKIHLRIQSMMEKSDYDTSQTVN